MIVNRRKVLNRALSIHADQIKWLLLLAFFLFIPTSSIAQGQELTYSEKTVHFYSGFGLKLTGVLSTPSTCGEENQRCPGIVLSNGPGGYKRPKNARKDTVTPAVSNWLSESGFVVLRFSYRGVGESEGPDYRLIPMEQVEDIQNGITFLQQHKGVDASRIGLIGFCYRRSQ